MVVRSTSIEAFEKLIKSGKQKAVKKAVALYLYHNGPHTQGEVAEKLSHLHRLSTVTPRFSELVKAGILRELPEKRNCTVTGEHVFEYDIVDGDVPLPPVASVAAPPPKPQGDAFKIAVSLILVRVGRDAKAENYPVKPDEKAVLDWLEYLSEKK